jgi:uncharacterized small protein (DUF1192 family)
MQYHKDKEMEKLSTPEVLENPVKDTPEIKVESKSEPISDAPAVEDRSEDTIKSLQGQISRLQKELNEKTDVRKQLQSLIGEDNAESDVDPVQALNTRLQSLESELSQSKSEIAKNNLIDGLDEPEPIKKYLKKHIPASTQDLEKEIEEGIKTAKELVEGLIPKTTDSRPKGVGAGSNDTSNMDYVLSHPELFKK